MGETILFCFVFASQILLISWFYPQRIISRMRYVLEKFPPDTHPKAYPQPLEHYERWLRNIACVNLAVVIAGLVIIALILGTLLGGWDGGIFASSRKKDWTEVIVIPFFLVQLAASVLYIHFSSRRLRQAMAKAPPPRVRTAELHRRRLVDFVSPQMLAIAALTNVAFFAFVLYCWYFELPRFTSSRAIGVATSQLLLLVAISVSVGIALRGRKPDPYLAQRDRLNLTKLVVQQALAVCIACPVILMALLTLKFFHPHLLQPVVSSLRVQALAVVALWFSYSYRADEVDYDVYRADASDSTPNAAARTSSP